MAVFVYMIHASGGYCMAGIMRVGTPLKVCGFIVMVVVIYMIYYWVLIGIWYEVQGY